MCMTLVGRDTVFTFRVIRGTMVTWDGPATEEMPTETFQELDDGENI